MSLSTPSLRLDYLARDIVSHSTVVPQHIDVLYVSLKRVSDPDSKNVYVRLFAIRSLQVLVKYQINAEFFQILN